MSGPHTSPASASDAPAAQAGSPPPTAGQVAAPPAEHPERPSIPAWRRVALVAFGLLPIAPFAFDSLFLVSFCIAVVGVAVLVLFVDGRPPAEAQRDVEGDNPPSLRDAARVIGLPGLRPLVVLGAMLGTATISDAFIYLALEESVG